MKFAKASALVVIVAGAFGLGVWIGPRLTERGDDTKQASPVAQASAPVSKMETKHAVRAPHPPPSSGRASPKHAASSGATPITVSAFAPDLQHRLKPLLNKGANIDIASQNFRDGEQFAMVAHAAHNTEIPFMVLKHRVVEEDKSLADAIHEFKPALDASGEAARARAEAKSDLAAIEG